ncbi:MAG: hypothetical protein EZS28_027960 [Streblomastix strix]|uniref:Uncharacterized protein n=1 Tax=Streblomastix strix TaxID=222440 RepID=A0A5J4V218_9EUKA|nr:MAG: hypothetical protein EZS28_027960 [Streblomastix strix]
MMALEKALQMAQFEWQVKRFVQFTLNMNIPGDITDALRNGQIIQFINKMLPNCNFKHYSHKEREKNFSTFNMICDTILNISENEYVNENE